MDAIRLKSATARNAFHKLDMASSKAAHDETANGGGVVEYGSNLESAAPAPEHHGGTDAKYIKSIVYGGLDGIITTFAVVASIAGAGLDTGIIIIMGFASLIADGMSMGMGDYLSSKAEVDYTKEERRREEWECENYIEGEKKEMVTIYTNKGMTRDDATALIDIMAKYNDIFVDNMMVEELGLMPVDASENPMKNGFVTFIAFLIFGFVPMAAYVVASIVGGSKQIADIDVTFIVACVMTLITMFGLGAYTAKFSTSRWYTAGTWMVLNGGATAAAAYFVGWGLSMLTGDHGHP